MEFQWLRQLDSPTGTQPQEMCHGKEGALIGIARHQEVLLVTCQLHLGANLVHARRQSLKVLIARELFQSF